MTDTVIPLHAAAGHAPGAATTMVMFEIGGQKLAAAAGIVREILEPLPVTRVPGAGPLVPEVANIRGSIVPVVHAGRALGLTEDAGSTLRRTIVMEADLGGETALFAVHADAVHDVFDMRPGDVAPVSASAGPWPAGLLQGMCRRNSEFVLLPDMPAILADRISTPSPSSGGLPAAIRVS